MINGYERHRYQQFKRVDYTKQSSEKPPFPAKESNGKTTILQNVQVLELADLHHTQHEIKE